jgi:hypothetical protein
MKFRPIGSRSLQVILISQPPTPDFSFPISDARNPVLDAITYWLEEGRVGPVNDGFAASHFNLVSHFQGLGSFEFNRFLESEFLPEFRYPSPSPASRPPTPPPSTLASGEQSSQASSGRSLSPLEIGRNPNRQVSLPH